MTNYSFIVERSSAILETVSATLAAGFRLEATPGSYALTAVSINLTKPYILQQAPDNTNNFTLNSVTPTVSLLQGRVLQAVNTTTPVFALTGQNTNLRITNARLVASRGFISLTGSQLTAIYLKSTTLPALRPTKREFIPPVHSTNNVRTINGFVSRRIFASVASGAELKLTYENLPESETSSLLELFDTALGTYRSVSLPAATFAGAEPALQAYLNLSGTNQRWAFTGPPTMETAAPGVHTVNISLRSRIVPASPRAPLPNLPACETPTATVCHPNVGTGGTSGVSNSLLQWLTPSGLPPLTDPSSVTITVVNNNFEEEYACTVGNCSGAIVRGPQLMSTSTSSPFTISYAQYQSRYLIFPFGALRACDTYDYFKVDAAPGFASQQWLSGRRAIGGPIVNDHCPGSTYTCPACNGNRASTWQEYQATYVFNS